MRLNSIQTLRGLAAVGVVLAHAGIAGIGVAGVDLFFVISGFIIARVGRGKTPLRFAFDRFWRVYPLYWLMLLPWLAMSISRGFDTPQRTLTSLTLIPLDTIPYLRPAWSLMYEVLFYAAATLVLATGRWRLVLFAFLVATIIGYVWPHPLPNYLGYPLAIEFLIGVGIARIGAVRRGIWMVPLGVILLFLAPDLSGGAIALADHQTYLRAIFWGVPCGLIVWGAVSSDGRWPLVWLGDASYSLYLVHLAPAVMFPGPVGVAIAITLGLAVHRWIERPILATRPRVARLIGLAERSGGGAGGPGCGPERPRSARG